MKREVKTNAMRILDKAGIEYKINLYECKQFEDAKSIADMLSQPYEKTYKTLVAQGRGKDNNHYVFCIPIDRELDLKKAAKAVGEKSIFLLPVKDLTRITGYIRGGCTPIGMKKQFLTVIDFAAKFQDEIIISGGKIGAQIFICPADLARVASARFCDICFEGSI